MSNSSATVDELNGLHGAIAKYLAGRVRDSTADPDDEDDFRLPLATGEVANIISFLKNNNISAAPDTEEIKELNEEFKNDIEARRIAKEAKLFTATAEELEQASWL